MEIRLVTAPGLEAVLAEEARSLGFDVRGTDPGGVEIEGDWQTAWRANLSLRGAARVLVRIGAFRAMHLAQLDKRSRKFDWAAHLGTRVPIKVEATCKASRIYHAGAARERVARALTEGAGIPLSADAPMRLLVRIEDDLCTFSIDTSGPALHLRGHKQAVGKAPLRETMAALFLRQAGFDGRERVVDPMCGSGTFPIEAAEWSLGLNPGRSRSFAFEHLPSFDLGKFANLETPATSGPGMQAFGSDRDAGAIRMATDNAARAGTSVNTTFACHPVSALEPPPGPPGLVITNPPYGSRIGNKKALFGLYKSLGDTMKQRFAGWRIGIVTSDQSLARATDLGIKPAGPPVAHGGLKVCLYLGEV